jgi:SnoaL-like domain
VPNASELAESLRHRLEIEQLLAEWAWLIDHGRAEEAAGLYANDAEQTIAGVTVTGIEAIREGLRRRAAMTNRTSRHVVSNLKLSGITASTLEAAWVLTLYRSDVAARPPTPTLVGDVRDNFRLESGQWKICSRQVVPIFAEP